MAKVFAVLSLGSFSWIFAACYIEWKFQFVSRGRLGVESENGGCTRLATSGEDDDASPTLNQNCFNVSCLPGYLVFVVEPLWYKSPVIHPKQTLNIILPTLGRFPGRRPSSPPLPPSRHKALNQCWFNAGPMSNQHWFNVLCLLAGLPSDMSPVNMEIWLSGSTVSRSHSYLGCGCSRQHLLRGTQIWHFIFSLGLHEIFYTDKGPKSVYSYK